MRHLFLTLDRHDLKFVTKKISRAMSQLTVNGDETVQDHGNEDLITLTVKILMHDYSLARRWRKVTPTGQTASHPEERGCIEPAYQQLVEQRSNKSYNARKEKPKNNGMRRIKERAQGARISCSTRTRTRTSRTARPRRSSR